MASPADLAAVVLLDTSATANPDPAKRIRAVWAERMAERLEDLGLTPKRFQRLLEDEEEIDVSLQTIYAWLSGSWAPSPSKQAPIARVLKIQPHRLFPLEAA